MNEPVIVLVAIAGFVISCWNAYRISESPKWRPRSSYQKEIDKYFANMRWYGFKDDDIADMIHTHHPDHHSLRMANKRAYKERKGKI